MDKKAEKLRDGIFDLHTRRFGKVAELMIKYYDALGDPKNKFHDLYDHDQDVKIEVKFSRAQKSHNEAVNEDNIIKSIENASIEERMFKSKEWKKYSFDCNIQQVKPSEFDILYYGIFFEDKVMVFKIDPSDLDKAIQYSNKQHKGNVGEGQFHLNQSTYARHLENFFETEFTYGELYELFSSMELE